MGRVAIFRVFGSESAKIRSMSKDRSGLLLLVDLRRSMQQMRYTSISCLILLCFCSCRAKNDAESGRDGPVVGAKKSVAIAATVEKDPDIAAERKKILDFFEVHKLEDTFYLQDRTYADWWGLWSSSINCVVAGHLFHKAHTHAVLYYLDDKERGTLAVYLKAGDGWQQIYVDTALSESLNMSFKDWNEDGILDLSLEHNRPVNTSDINYSVYLIDKAGKAVHAVEGFEELRSPEIDTITRQIITENQYREAETFGIYNFAGSQLKEISTICIYDYWGRQEKDAKWTIVYEKKGEKYKEVKAETLRQLPAPIKRRSLFYKMEIDG